MRIFTWLLMTMGELHRSTDKAQLDSKANTIRTMLGVLENKLGEGPYFDGANFSFVDIWFGPVVPYFDIYQQHTALDFLDGTPKLQSYFKRLAARESVANAIPPDAQAYLLKVMKDRDSEFSKLISAR